MTNDTSSERSSSASLLIFLFGCVLLGIITIVLAIYIVEVRGPHDYISTSRVLVSRKRPIGLGFVDDEEQQQIDLSSELQLIRSKAVVKQAIASGDLDKLSSMKGEPASEILQGLRIEQIAGTDVIQIDFQSPDQMDAQTIVAAVTKAYVEYRNRQVEDAHRKPWAKLNEAVNEVQTDLNRLEEEFETAATELDDQQPKFERLGDD